MDFTIGSLELNRTNPAHLGTRALTDVTQRTFMDASGNISNTGAAAPKQKGMFEQYLLDAMSGMNDQQMQVTKLQEQVITDPDSVDIHDVTTAMAKAKMSMTLAQTVIERLVSGWNELSQTR